MPGRQQNEQERDTQDYCLPRPLCRPKQAKRHLIMFGFRISEGQEKQTSRFLVRSLQQRDSTISLYKLVSHTSSLCLMTEDMTGTNCMLVVKWTIPSNPFSCCSDTMTAAPAMNPIKVAFDRKSIRNPNLSKEKPLRVGSIPRVNNSMHSRNSPKEDSVPEEAKGSLK